jgi:nucleoside-diphosphate-sugar epimerase
MTSNGKQILVTGGTGKTGRRVAGRLRERHLPVRVASCAEIAAASGRDVRYVPVSTEEYAATSGVWNR